MSKPKIMVLDIETCPHVGYFWGTHKQYIPIENVKERGRVISIAWMYIGDKKVHQVDESKDSRSKMLEETHKAMSEADAIVTWNGDRFDIPRLMGEFLQAGLPPPPPVTSIDLIKTVRKLGLPSSKLSYVGPVLLGDYKVKHEGFSLWLKCMNEQHAEYLSAWKKMRRYNVGDVKLTASLYGVLKPWIKNHPYLGEHKGTKGEFECPRCGETENYQHRGYRRTATTTTERIRCGSCGGWSKGKQRRAA